MKQVSRSSGFILVTTLILLIFFATLAQRFAEDFFARTRTLKIIVDRTQARSLAYDTLALALAEITPKKSPEKPAAKESGSKVDAEEALAGNPIGLFYYKLLRVLNKPQIFLLTKEWDGISGAIGFNIAAEDGKIDLNAIYDFKKRDLFAEWAKLMDRFSIKVGKGPKAKRVELGKALREFFSKKLKSAGLEKEGSLKIYDVRELDLKENLTIVSPPNFLALAAKKAEKNGEEARLVSDGLEEGKKDEPLLLVGDLFTCCDLKKLNPILLSPVIQKGLGITTKSEKASSGQEPAKDDPLLELCKKIDSKWPGKEGWGQHLELLRKVWPDGKRAEVDSEKQTEKNNAGYNLILGLLCQEIAPKFLTVTCWAKYGLCEFRIVTLCQRVASIDESLRDTGALDRQNIYTYPGYKVVRVYEGY